MLLARNDRAVAVGLCCRPPAGTVAYTLSWLRENTAHAVFPTVLSPERETQPLQDRREVCSNYI